MCAVLSETGELITVQIPEGGSSDKLRAQEHVVIVRSKYRQARACTGLVESIDGDEVKIKLEQQSVNTSVNDDSNLTECQLPAMFRPRSQDGFYGCWRGAFIVKHGPDRLYIQVEENQTIPKNTELMFSPIGSDSGPSTGRMYGDDGSVINASDVRSRRIRVRAITRDVLPSETPGTVTLVMDITRTLYRTA